MPDDGPRGDKDARGDPRPRERERSKREEQRDAREETHLRLDQRRAEEPGGRLGVIRGRGDHRDHARAREHRESAFDPAFLSGFLRHPPGTLVLHCRHGSAGDGSISVDQTHVTGGGGGSIDVSRRGAGSRAREGVRGVRREVERDLCRGFLPPHVDLELLVVPASVALLGLLGLGDLRLGRHGRGGPAHVAEDVHDGRPTLPGGLVPTGSERGFRAVENAEEHRVVVHVLDAVRGEGDAKRGDTVGGGVEVVEADADEVAERVEHPGGVALQGGRTSGEQRGHLVGGEFGDGVVLRADQRVTTLIVGLGPRRGSLVRHGEGGGDRLGTNWSRDESRELSDATDAPAGFDRALRRSDRGRSLSGVRSKSEVDKEAARCVEERSRVRRRMSAAMERAPQRRIRYSRRAAGRQRLVNRRLFTERRRARVGLSKTARWFGTRVCGFGRGRHPTKITQK